MSDMGLAEVEVITFDELVEYGRAHAPNLVSGMPWSFNWRGFPVTHENDDCYLIPIPGGTVRFERGDTICIGVAKGGPA